MNPLRNEKGFSVLLLALMILLVMTALGIAALQTSQRELRSVNKLKISTQAFYSAESGVTIATAELNSLSNDVIESHMVGDINPDNPWKDELLDQLKGIRGGTATSPYIPNQELFYFGETHYNLSNMQFETTVAFLGTGLNITCYGMKGSDPKFEIGTLQEFYTANKIVGKDFWPVLIITSTGIKGNPAGGLFKYAERNVRIRVQAKPSFTFPEAALTLNGDLDPNGTPNSIVGEGTDPDDVCPAKDIVGLPGKNLTYPGNFDWCVTEDDPEGIACKPEGESVEVGYSPDLDGDGNPDPYPVDAVVAALISQGTPVDPSNNLSLGSVDDPDGIYYYDGNMHFEADEFGANNIEGYGILVIKGDLDLGGKIEWRGMIIVTGDVEFSGGGGNDRYIEGAVIAGGNVRVDGNPDIYFDCGMVLDFWKSTSKFHTMWWREIKGRL